MTAASAQNEKRRGWRAWRYLALRRCSQFAVLGLFLLGPLAGIWVLRGNLSSSILLDTVPLSDPYIALQSLLAGNTLEFEDVARGGVDLARRGLPLLCFRLNLRSRIRVLRGFSSIEGLVAGSLSILGGPRYVFVKSQDLVVPSGLGECADRFDRFFRGKDLTFGEQLAKAVIELV